MRHTRVAIIGTGAVGSTTAYALMWKNVAAELILVDACEQRCTGEVLDLSDAIPFCCTSNIKRGTFADASQADIIIVAAGARQHPDQPRSELLKTNARVVSQIMQSLHPINPNAILIMVTNPVDVMAWIAKQHCNLPHTRLFGTGTYLDTQRLCGILSHHLHVAECSIHAYVLGEHGDTQFAAWSNAQIAGIPISQYPSITPEFLEKVAQEAKERVYQIIACKDATYYGIAACVADMVESIVFNKRRIMPLSCFLEEHNVYLSLPVILGEEGITSILQPPLSGEEKQKFVESIRVIQMSCDEIKK